MPPPDLPPGTHRGRQQGSTFYVAGDVRAPLRALTEEEQEELDRLVPAWLESFATA
jgi:hypothetical protein